MRILLAPDSFKGTLSSIEVINILEKCAARHFSPLEIIRVPIADGGEGTVEALVTAAKGQYRYVEVTGPLGKKVNAAYGIINNNVAVVEMAQASGLPLIQANERNPLAATTYGTGEIIKAALDEGIREFIIGIGGSATNDGGIGAAQALGVSFSGEDGCEAGFGGQHLASIKNIDTAGIDPRIKVSSITVICDVNNPLTGERGATYVYGPQKGADAGKLQALEAGMKSYSELIKAQLGIDPDSIPGSGAAGGLGAALVAFMGASLRPGIDTILEIVNFDELLEGVDLVVTGEGRIDGQSLNGKVPVGIAGYCKNKGIPVAVIAGAMGEGIENIYDCGIKSIMTTASRPMSLEEVLSKAEELMEDAADRMFRFIKIGYTLDKNK